jgi:hypothetical protein
VASLPQLSPVFTELPGVEQQATAMPVPILFEYVV